MFLSPYAQMQKAVDIVHSSPHPVNKIAAALFGQDQDGQDYSVSSTNYWPENIVKTIGTSRKIGGSSGTIHAETGCILKAPYTDGASICVTDPFCPNCAKNMAEAGIKTIYIDHKGFQKDFALRRGSHFEAVSMQICEKAGISVYELYRKEERLVPIWEAPESFSPFEDSPAQISAIDVLNQQSFDQYIDDAEKLHYGRKFAIAGAIDKGGSYYIILVRSHPALGYCMQRDKAEMIRDDSKYNFVLEPVSRLLMNAARNGLTICDGYLYSSVVPTSREQVNMVGAGLMQVIVGDKERARDETAFDAMKLLSMQNIIRFIDTAH